MKRRRFLKTVGLGTLVSTAGCIADGGEDDSSNQDDDNRTGNGGTDDGSSEIEFRTHVFDSGSGQQRVLEDGVVFRHDIHQYYVTVMGEKEETSRFNFSNINDEDAESFIKDTEFEESYLVVIQVEPASSSPDYRVEEMKRDGNTLDIRINNSSKGGTGDITVETVLVRVSRNGQTPEEVSVTTEDGTTFTSSEGVKTVPNQGMKDGKDKNDDDEDKKDCDSMHDSVIEVEHKTSSLEQGYSPIDFSSLGPEEKKILKKVVENGSYTTCDASDGFNRFVKRVSEHRNKQSDKPMVHLEYKESYYGLYVEKLDQVYSYDG